MLGKYRLVAELGHGGMGDVYLATTKGPGGFNTLVVLKRLRNFEDPQHRAMFLDEARLARRLFHPNIVQTYEVGQEEGNHFIVMEYLAGPTLQDLRRSAGLVPPTMEIEILCNVLEGLHYAHELKTPDGRPLHLVHRDLCAENVIVTGSGEVKVVDFGVAKIVDSIGLTQSGFTKGKLRNMPREQLMGPNVDRRADIFSTGVMLWEGLTGRPMWGDLGDAGIASRLTDGELPSLPDLGPSVRGELREICARALSVAPDGRFPTALAFKDALLAYMSRTHQSVTKTEVAAFVEPLFVKERERIDRMVVSQSTAARSRQPDTAPAPANSRPPEAGSASYSRLPEAGNPGGYARPDGSGSGYGRAADGSGSGYGRAADGSGSGYGRAADSGGSGYGRPAEGSGPGGYGRPAEAGSPGGYRPDAGGPAGYSRPDAGSAPVPAMTANVGSQQAPWGGSWSPAGVPAGAGWTPSSGIPGGAAWTPSAPGVAPTRISSSAGARPGSSRRWIVVVSLLLVGAGIGGLEFARRGFQFPGRPVPSPVEATTRSLPSPASPPMTAPPTAPTGSSAPGMPAAGSGTPASGTSASGTSAAPVARLRERARASRPTKRLVTPPAQVRRPVAHFRRKPPLPKRRANEEPATWTQSRPNLRNKPPLDRENPYGATPGSPPTGPRTIDRDAPWPTLKR